MELTSQKPGVVCDFNDLDEFTVRACPAYFHAESGHDAFIGVVELISVPVTLGDLFLTVRRKGQGIFFDMTGVCSKTHGAALLSALCPLLYLTLSEVKPFFHKIYDRRLGIEIKLRAVGL